jgi:FtsP/CotA-like multicopper oxidase with cupredoxin domain
MARDDRKSGRRPLHPRALEVNPVSRRGFLKVGTAGLLTAGGAMVYAGRARSQTLVAPDTRPLRDIIDPCFNDSPVAPPFSWPLTVAPALPTPEGGGPAVYELNEARGEHQFIPGIRTPIWGYNVLGSPGIVPGPTILARKLRPVIIQFTNRLPPDEEPNAIIIENNSRQDPEKHPFLSSSTVVHMHGINTDMQSDGYPENRREPGQTATHVYPNNEYQRPATLWYHDHSVHITSLHVYRGLAAFYILQDEIEDALGLPGTATADPGRGYGVFDVPLVLKDVMIAPKEMDGRPRGTLVYNNCSHHGAYGDVMTVNGRQQPFLEVANRKYRFRILDGSDARQYMLALRRVENLKDGPDEPFTLIGTDHGLLPAPEETTYVHLAIAERNEIVIDFSRYPLGTRLVLVNLLVDPSDRKLFPLMAFDVTRAEPDPSRVPPVLRGPEHPADVAPPARVRHFLFNRQGGYWSINSMQWDPARVDARPILDTNEEWILENEAGGWGHPVHIHLGRFRTIEVEGREPRPGELTGFKDTIWVGPNQTVRVVHQFWNFPGRFVFHCHNASHEDHDMMSQFEVEPG